MKEHPILFSAPMVQALLADRKHVTRRMDKRWLKVKAGDRLWVRETWTGTWCHEDMHLVYAADGSERMLNIPDVPSDYCLPKVAINPAAWITPLFMPRWASRILLECEEDARLERLQDITEEDAELEGVEPHLAGTSWGPKDWARVKTYRTGFVSIWRSLHAKPGERWEDNPEVVRVGRFRRIR